MHPKLSIDKWQLFDSIGYNPHPGQVAFHKSEAIDRVCSCGWGWGKSTAGAREYEALLLSPGVRIWIVGPDYKEASREFQIFWDDLVVTLGVEFAEARNSPDQGVMRLRTPDSVGGSVLEVKTERNPYSLEAEDVDAIIYAEAGQMKRKTHERLFGRRRMGKSEAVYLFTPEGFGWTHDDLWKPAIDPEEPEFWGHRGPSWENPAISRDWLARAKRRLTPAMYEAKIEGRFRTSTGFVFSDFDPAVHVTELEQLSGKPLYGGVDYGYTNPFVVLDEQTNTADQLCILREYYKSFVTTQDHATEMQSWKRDYKLLLADPAGADETATLRAAGFRVQPQMCEIKTGNELIQQSLKLREDGKPGLLIDHRCKNTIREFERYRYPGSTRDELEMKEAPLKKDDHTPEAHKRVVSYLTGIQRAGDFKPATSGARQFKTERMPRDYS